MEMRMIALFGIVATSLPVVIAKSHYHRRDPCNVERSSTGSGSAPMSFCRIINSLVDHAKNMKPYAEQIQCEIAPLLGVSCEHYDADGESFIDISLCEPKPMYLHEMLTSIWTLMYDLRDLVDYVTSNGNSNIAKSSHSIFNKLRYLFKELSKEWDHAMCFLSSVFKPRLQPRPYSVPEVKRLNYDDDTDELLRAYIVAKDITRTVSCLEGLQRLTGCHCQHTSSSF